MLPTASSLFLPAQIVIGYSFLQILILVVVLTAAAMIVTMVLQRFGVTIDPMVMRIFWICVIAFVACFALYFLFGLIGRMGSGSFGAIGLTCVRKW